MKVHFKEGLIPILVGATGVGKTALSLQWAEQNHLSILSADSMQVYRGMDIGTAKVSLVDRQDVKHYLIDIKNPDEPWSLNHFLEAAKPLLASGQQLMIVGGTGLYIRALLQGYTMPESAADPVFRERLYDRANREGILSLHQELEIIDPESGASIKRSDAFRIIRALEIIEQTGKKASEAKQQNPDKNRFQLIVLNRPRNEIYHRIEARVDTMIEKGLIDEVKTLLDAGYDPSLPSLQGLGYKEIISYLMGAMTLTEAIDLIKKRSRHFAKRQLTWYRSFVDAQWVNLEE